MGQLDLTCTKFTKASMVCLELRCRFLFLELPFCVSALQSHREKSCQRGDREREPQVDHNATGKEEEHIK